MVQPKIFIYLAFSFSSINRSHCHFRNIAPVLTLLPLLPLLSLSFFFFFSPFLFPSPTLTFSSNEILSESIILCAPQHILHGQASLSNPCSEHSRRIQKMTSLPLQYWCCYFCLNTTKVFFFFSQHLNFFFSKPIFVISYPFLLFLRLSSLWPITITLVLNSLSTSLTILSSLLTATYLLWLDANTPLLWKKKKLSNTWK